MAKTTVEHQNMGCRLCPAPCHNGDQTAYLLCPKCQALARAAPDLLAALKAGDELWAMLPFDSGADIAEIAERVQDIQDAAIAKAELPA